MSYQYIVVNINYSQPMANGPFHNLELAKEYAEDVFPYGGFWILPIIQPTQPTWKNPNRQKHNQGEQP